MPDELAEQIPMVHAACEALGVPILTSERFEADDVIGTLAEKAAAAGFDVAIVTGDKDFFQLVRDGIRVYNPKEEGTWYDAEGVKEKFGVPPELVVDVLALMGDSIDNIKGVPGIGEKGAKELIAQYGSLDNLLAHAGDVKHKRYREGLLGNAEAARQSRQLAKIRIDVPVEFDAEALRFRGGSREKCFQIFNELGFRAFAKEYAPTASSTVKTYRTITTVDDVQALAGRLRANGRFALRVLTDGPTAMRAAVVGLAFSTSPRDADYVPTGHRALSETASLPLEATLEHLRPILEDETLKKAGHDLKFDAIVLAQHGVTLRGFDTDTMLASYLIDATRSEHKLEDLALEHTSYKALSEEDICGRGTKAMSLAELPVEAAVDYAVRARRPGRSARADFLRTAREGRVDGGLRDDRAAADSGAGCRGAGGHSHRRPRAGGAVAQDRAGPGAAHRQHLRRGRRRVQHQFTEAAGRDPLRQAAAAGSEAHRHIACAVDGR